MDDKKVSVFRCGVAARAKQMGLKCLLTKEEIQRLWRRDRAWILESPQIDRIDTRGHYEFVNCRFIAQNHNVVRSRMGIGNWGIKRGGAMKKDVSVRISYSLLESARKYAEREGRTLKGQIECMIKTAFALYADQEIARKKRA